MANYLNNKFEITQLTKSIFKLQTFEVGCQQKDMKETHRLMLELSKGKKYAVLRIACACFYSSDKMKTMIESKPFTDACYAVAYVVKSLANRLCAQFVIQFHNSVAPSRMFEHEAAAMEWLKEQEAMQYGKE
ncbi:MAG: hypothetical protein HY840_05505 [Bacteroidetes bacterium]|nr:hypothetical protein [Bacteroidota bacterium]